MIVALQQWKGSKSVYKCLLKQTYGSADSRDHGACKEPSTDSMATVEYDYLICKDSETFGLFKKKTNSRDFRSKRFHF